MIGPAVTGSRLVSRTSCDAMAPRMISGVDQAGSSWDAFTSWLSAAAKAALAAAGSTFISESARFRMASARWAAIQASGFAARWRCCRSRTSRPSSFRRKSAAFAARVSPMARYDPPGISNVVRSYSAPLASYLEKVRSRAYTITDDDVDELKRAGVSEDEIFEATVSVALAEGVRRLDAAARVIG